MTTAIIVAGGASRRMGSDKLLADLAGKPVILHTVEAFENCPEIDDIIVVGTPDICDVVMGGDLSESKILACSSGGAERHLSVRNGLRFMQPGTKLVAVHDGARPLITPGAIARCLQAAARHGAAACARPVTDTLKRADADGTVAAPIDREGVWAMETPQCFQATLLLEAYKKVLADGITVTDEVSAAEHAGHPVHLVNTGTPNPKITFPEDLETAARLLGGA